MNEVKGSIYARKKVVELCAYFDWELRSEQANEILHIIDQIEKREQKKLEKMREALNNARIARQALASLQGKDTDPADAGLARLEGEE